MTPGRVDTEDRKLLYLEELKSNVDSSDEQNGKTYVCEKRIVAPRRLNTRQHRKPMKNPPQKHN
jgi:hypothetical protein